MYSFKIYFELYNLEILVHNPKYIFGIQSQTYFLIKKYLSKCNFVKYIMNCKVAGRLNF